MQIKATLRYPCTSNRCKMKRLTIQVLAKKWRHWDFTACWWDCTSACRWYNHCEKQFGNFLKGKILPTKSSSHSLLGVCAREIKACIYLNTWIFISALFVIVKNRQTLNIHSVQFSSVAQSCLTLCDPMNRSTPGLPVHHQLLEFTQTHVHRDSKHRFKNCLHQNVKCTASFIEKVLLWKNCA